MEDIFRLGKTQLGLFNRPYKRYFLRENDLNRRFCIILGQRGVGKTTAMVQHLLERAGGDLDSEKILYVQSDHFLLRQRSLYEIAETFSNLGGEIICFDEIHKYPRWSMELKSIVDTFGDLKVLASGSSALQIAKGSHDLSRRALHLRMVGMSFREYIELSTGTPLPYFRLEDVLERHAPVAREVVSAVAPNKVLALFKRYLRHGCYPFYFEDSDEAVFWRLLNQNMHAVLESDLMAAQPSLTGSSNRKIAALLRVVSESVPFCPDYSKLATLTDVGDQRTLKTYLKYLEDSCLIAGLSRSGRGLKELEKPDKIYLNNPNLNFAFSDSPDIGTVRETFFMNMLSFGHSVKSPFKGDFLVDDALLFEIGGPKKSFSQIKDVENSFVAADDIESGFGKKVPLWLFGFLY